MTISTTHIVSHYAQPKPKGLHWNPRPLKLAKKHPVSLRERISSAQPSTPGVAQPVVQVQAEHYEANAWITGELIQGQLGDTQSEFSSSNDPNSPPRTNPELTVTYSGMSPQDFLRNALPVTHTFIQPVLSNNRLDIAPSHRLRPSSSLSNISSGSTRSRPPSAMSTSGHINRSSSRASIIHRVPSSPSVASA